MGEMPAARPQDHGSGQMSGWAAEDRMLRADCAGGARAPAACEPWAPARHRWGPPRPAAAPPVRRPAAAPPVRRPAAAPPVRRPAADPPGPHPPAAAAGPPGPGPPAATPPGIPRPGGPPPARQQG